jgi:hypothetical protein
MENIKMKVYSLTTMLLLSIIGLCGCSYCNRYFSLPDDHLGEEFLEELVEQETGLEIDFTP